LDPPTEGQDTGKNKRKREARPPRAPKSRQPAKKKLKDAVPVVPAKAGLLGMEKVMVKLPTGAIMNVPKAFAMKNANKGWKIVTPGGATEAIKRAEPAPKPQPAHLNKKPAPFQYGKAPAPNPSSGAGPSRPSITLSQPKITLSQPKSRPTLSQPKGGGGGGLSAKQRLAKRLSKGRR